MEAGKSLNVGVAAHISAERDGARFHLKNSRPSGYWRLFGSSEKTLGLVWRPVNTLQKRSASRSVGSWYRRHEPSRALARGGSRCCPRFFLGSLVADSSLAALLDCVRAAHFAQNDNTGRLLSEFFAGQELALHCLKQKC